MNKIINYIKNKVMYLIAKIFGKYTIGIDFAEGNPKSTTCEAYIFRGVVYIKNIKEL